MQRRTFLRPWAPPPRPPSCPCGRRGGRGAGGSPCSTPTTPTPASSPSAPATASSPAAAASPDGPPSCARSAGPRPTRCSAGRGRRVPGHALLQPVQGLRGLQAHEHGGTTRGPWATTTSTTASKGSRRPWPRPGSPSSTAISTQGRPAPCAGACGPGSSRPSRAIKVGITGVCVDFKGLVSPKNHKGVDVDGSR